MDISTFRNKWTGQRIDYDHVYGYQCVDLILQYVYENFGIGGGVWGNAIDYWTKPSAPLMTKFDRLETNDVQQGDIVIMNGLPGNPYGHIGIGTGADNGSQAEILEQNGQTGNGDGQSGNAVRTRLINKSRIAGVLRPKQEAPAPAPEPPAPAAPSHPYTVEDIDPVTLQANANPTHEWDLDYTTWSGIGSHPENALAPGTPVQVVARAHHNLGSVYYMTDRNQPNGYNVVDLGPYTPPTPDPVPTPQPVVEPPAPDPTPVPAPAPAAAPQPEIKFERLPAPVKYTTNKQPTDVWDFDFTKWLDIEAHVVRQLNSGADFTAAGRAFHQLGGVYLMTADDFGQADVTGVPTNYSGINIVDLNGTTDAAPAAPLVQPVVNPGSGDDNSIPVAVTPTPGTVITPAAEPAGTVKVTTSSNPAGTTATAFSGAADWRNSFKESVQALVSKEDMWVEDLEGKLEPRFIAAGRLIPKAGIIWKDGQKFVLTIPSKAKGEFFGIPAHLAGAVAPEQRKRAQVILENIWDKYHKEIEDELDMLFHEGMNFENQAGHTFSDIAQKTTTLHGRDKWTDVAARVLFRANKNKK
jgi:hypothetical protein